MPTKSEAIQRFLIASTFPDLASLYSIDMECQVNVAQDGGTRIDGEYKGRNWHGYTDGATTWKSFRIPYSANKDPSYDDSEITWELPSHVEAIGMTGWDWKNRVSRWIGFDFDSLVEHKAGLSTDELDLIKESVCKIPWVTVRKSTSGSGLHVYVFLDIDSEINTHTEHAALARAILGQMSALSGYDFQVKVDGCGSILWVWHRKMKGTDGLRLIKQGEVLTEVPINWKDHIKVVTGTRRKNLPKVIEDSGHTDLFDVLTSQRTHIPLDVDHKKLIDWLKDNDCLWWWDSDNHLLVTHTTHLQDAHKALGMRGFFSTISVGKEKGQDHNVFLYPLRLGAWSVRRFTLGVQEHPSWNQDKNGWTYCYLNQEPDLSTAAKAKGGLEDPAGGYIFREAEVALDAASLLGVHTDISLALRNRKTKLKEHKDGRLIIEIDHDPQDRADEMPSWLPNKGKWTKIFTTNAAPPNESDSVNYDDLLRHCITETSEDYGWVINVNSQWCEEPLVHVKLAMKSLGYNDKEVTSILGASIFKCWKLVNKPFQLEYPGEREWNKKAAQLKYRPSTDTENLTHPTWDLVLNHVGNGLNDAVKLDPWARSNNILTGADYLRCWIHSLITEPLEPLPYLFLYSQQQMTGKSVFHEALSILFTRGYKRADAALTNPSGFNGELEGAVLCAIEETDLRRNKNAYSLIKDWVTAREILIHRKGETPYHMRNSTHWIQTANDHNFCPIFPGDTRITMIYVSPINPLDMIQKKKLLIMLEKEIPDFLASILTIEPPTPGDRLNIPVIATEEKIAAQASNMSMLEIFVNEKCQLINGKKLKISDFYDKFMEWLDPSEVHNWSKIRLGREMPLSVIKGRDHSNGQWHYGNITWSGMSAQAESFKYILKDEYLEEQT
ncbi:MAG: DUF5906 domain-containing protein [Proteobacteria bacterium]|jgi:hypothetical protein|nr:DUF5906 domain-containing protein [Pseudomonadota bacterium]